MTKPQDIGVHIGQGLANPRVGISHLAAPVLERFCPALERWHDLSQPFKPSGNFLEEGYKIGAQLGSN